MAEQREGTLSSHVAKLAAKVDKAFPRADRRKGGRPPYPTEIMVRMVFMRALYNLSDEDREHQVLDRTSFQRFCRLDASLHIPDARTLHLQAAPGSGRPDGRAIFEAVSLQLQQHGYVPRGGQIVDASIVQAHIAQVRSAERKSLNESETPEDWTPKRVQLTDSDARWIKKHGTSFYGYKMHSNVDARKMIRRIEVTPANVDDGQTLNAVLDTTNTRDRLLADRGYDSATNRDLFKQHPLHAASRTELGPGNKLANGSTLATAASTRRERVSNMCSPGWSSSAASCCER